jgi:hypothetical protein
MPYVDYKISRITQGHLYTYVLAYISLGDITTENEEVRNGVTEAVTRYRRTELIDTVALEYAEEKTRDEIELILKQRLATARADTPAIEEQRLA